MSMHLMKIRVVEKSNKKKWPSAEAKRKAEELQESWDKLKSKYEPTKRVTPTLNKPSAGPKVVGPRGPNKHIPSLGDGIGNGTKPDQKVYSGDAMLGISTLHKSNAVPVFSAEDAKDHATMRR